MARAVAADKKMAPRGRRALELMVRIVAGRVLSRSARRVHGVAAAWSGRRSPGAGVVGLSLLSVVSLSACAGLDEWQRKLALRPTPTQSAHQQAAAASWRAGDERFTLPATGAPQQPVALWWLPHADPQAPALLYLHGTFRNLYQNQPKIDALRQAGFAILAVDYRGWGDSAVLVPSEASINADAQLAWTELQRRQRDPGKRVIYGHSMGGAVAVTLASGLQHGRDYQALVLESTFTRMPDVAASAGFWGRVAASTTTLEFDSLSRISRIEGPLLMLHGTADKTVPIELGRRLRDAAPAGVRWVEIPGGTHSRLQLEAPEIYQQAFQDLIFGQKRLPKAPQRAASP